VNIAYRIEYSWAARGFGPFLQTIAVAEDASDALDKFENRLRYLHEDEDGTFRMPFIRKIEAIDALEVIL